MKYIKLKTRQTFLCISKSDDLTVNYSDQCSGLGVPNSAECCPEVRRLWKTLHHSLCLRTTQDTYTGRTRKISDNVRTNIE